jgi:predicted hydrocarbon binding protein
VNKPIANRYVVEPHRTLRSYGRNLLEECFVLASEKILKELVKTGYNRYFEKKTENRIRPKLGNNIDLTILQVQLIGALALSKAMSVALFESGRKFTKSVTTEGMASAKKVQGSHGLGESETLEEARKSAEIIALQATYESTGIGLLTLTEFEKDKLIVFQVEECFSCYGITNIGKPICYYTGGALAGFVEGVLQKDAAFVESKCYANGDSCCEFRYNISGQ